MSSASFMAWIDHFGWAVFLAAAVACYGLLLLLLPALTRHAMAHPNARSSHKVPTPQGGGIAVIAATFGVVIVATLFGSDSGVGEAMWLVLTATVFIALVGAIDDVRPIPVLPRLLLQALGTVFILIALPDTLRVLPTIPFWLERALTALAIVWFVNLTNFMDGIDWITVAEVVPVCAGLALFGLMGALPPQATLVALALCGAIVGFAPFNKPVARVFLGDVGSLPLGLLLGWLLVLLGGLHLTAALLLPLYYLADATITLARRTMKGERIVQAHRSHFYQRAVDGRLGVYQIVARIFLVNLVLIALAASTLLSHSYVLHGVALLAGCVVVGLLLYSFERAKA